MANFKSDDFIINLGKHADNYISECLAHTKEVVSGSGKVIEVRDRHIPTIDYFLRIWIPIVRKEKSIVRETYYTWLNSDDKLKSDTIKKIDDLFKGLAIDIVGNEGKGIFYAKNLLGWTDRAKTEEKQEISITYENRPTE